MTTCQRAPASRFGLKPLSARQLQLGLHTGAAAVSTHTELADEGAICSSAAQACELHVNQGSQSVAAVREVMENRRGKCVASPTTAGGAVPHRSHSCALKIFV